MFTLGGFARIVLEYRARARTKFHHNPRNNGLKAKEVLSDRLKVKLLCFSIYFVTLQLACFSYFLTSSAQNVTIKHPLDILKDEFYPGTLFL